jgi:hypothetical protein
MTIFVMGVVKINEFNLELTIVNMSKSLSSNIKVALCDLQRPLRLYFILLRKIRYLVVSIHREFYPNQFANEYLIKNLEKF